MRPSCKPWAELLERRDAPATLTVTDNGDNGGANQLRQVILGAGNGDTILFNLPRGRNIIRLNSEIDTNLTNLTISGGNANANVTITDPSGRAFFFGDPDPNNLQVVSETIQYLAFTNCGTNASIQTGAAIGLDGSLSVSNCRFQNNQASYGGAVWVMTNGWNGDSVSFANSQFVSNQAGAGGAIYVEGDGSAGSDGVAGSDTGWITLTNDSFTGNQANGGLDAYGNAVTGNGGAIMTGDPLSVATFTSTDCMFQNNSASNSGGAIYTTFPLTVTAQNSVSEFSNNTADYQGGAIYWSSSTGALDTSLTLTNLTFGTSATTPAGQAAPNTADSGGAVYAATNMTTAAATEAISQCLFNGNKALGSYQGGGYGGALVVNNTTGGSGSATLAVTNSTFYQNQADTAGGGISICNTANGALANNTATLTSDTIYSNSAASGGGLYVDTPAGASRLRVGNSIIAGNSSTGQGLDVFAVNNCILSQGYNFIGSADNSNQGCWNATDNTGTDAVQIDPGLGPLQDNGGKTMTLFVDPTTNTAVYRRGNANLAGTLDECGLTRAAGNVTIGAYDPDAS